MWLIDMFVDGYVSIDDVRGMSVLLFGNGLCVDLGLWCVDVDFGEIVVVWGGEFVDVCWMLLV